MDGHTLGKKIKHYHPKHPKSDPTDPLYHPKVGVSLKRKRTDHTVYWSDRDELNELDELLINVLAWSGITTRSGDTFISDAYFASTESVRELRLVDNPLPNIKDQQETAIVEGLTGNPDLNESDRECLQTVSDGGQTDVDKVAEQTDYSTRTIYRACDRMGDLVDAVDGSVGFVSDYVRKEVEAVLSELESLMTESDGSGSNGASAWQRWLNAHAIEAGEDDGKLELRFGEVGPTTTIKEIKERLESGLMAWRKSGRDPNRFRFGKGQYTTAGDTRYLAKLLR
jgi:hypothetical protein